MEATRREAWTDNSRYFDTQSVQTSKNAQWESVASYEKSMAKWYHEASKDDKDGILKSRRSKLKTLLESDRESLTQELITSRPTSRGELLNQYRERTEELKTQRESARQQLVDEKHEMLMKERNVALRDADKIASTRFYDQERKKQVIENERAMAAHHKELEKLKQKAILDQENRQLEDQSRAKQDAEKKNVYRGVLKEQIASLNAQEKMAVKLKAEHDALLIQQSQLASEKQRREDKERREKQLSLGRQLQRQHKVQMIRKSQEIQLQIEQDMKLLESLAQAELEQAQEQTKRREVAQLDVEWMKKEVQQQLLNERERQTALEDMYRDEASRISLKQEREWEQERVAREKLMAQVYQERQKQVEEKLDHVRAKQLESLQQRQELLEHIEMVHEVDKQEKEQRQRTVKFRQDELGEQVRARQTREEQDREQKTKEEELERERELAEAREVEAATSRLLTTPYRPPGHGRRRIAWD